MRCGIRYSSFALVSALLLCFGASSSAQQIRFEDFSSAAGIKVNVSNSTPNRQVTVPPVLRLTDGAPNIEATTVYFDASPASSSGGKQPVAGGFTTWFRFQIHDLVCCNPGDGFAFIVQNSSSVDSTMGATGQGLTALGAGGNTGYGNQDGAMGYAGIKNSLAIEFDVHEDAWDPTSNHIAVQTCGPNNANTPVHDSGTYTIGNNNNVTSCLLYQSQASIDSSIKTLGGSCSDGSCTDGTPHDVVIQYTPGQPTGTLQIWLDPTYFDNTHTPTNAPTMIVPYNINDPSYGLSLDPLNGGSAWVGFTASQPNDSETGEKQDILAWEFTPHVPTSVTQLIPPGGVPAVYAFGSHQTTITYPIGFSNPNGITMTVKATPVDRATFYQTRLLGTGFANEQCIVYEGTGNGFIANGNCIVYTVSCQQSGSPVSCPTASGNSDIGIVTMYNSLDPITANNADFLETCPTGSNNWFSIFQAFYNDGQTTSGGSNGFGNSPSGNSCTSGQGYMNADIVATFRPGQSGKR